MQIERTRQIDSQAIIKYSNRFTLPIPDVFIEANQIEAKDKMEVFRENINGCDALVIIPKKSIIEAVES